MNPRNFPEADFWPIWLWGLGNTHSTTFPCRRWLFYSCEFGVSGNNPGIQREANVAGKTRRNGARALKLRLDKYAEFIDSSPA